MPYSIGIYVWYSVIFFVAVFNHIIAQNNCCFTVSQDVFLPIVDTKNKIEVSFEEICQKSSCVQFLSHNKSVYLKTIFSITKDTLSVPPQEKYKTEIEIKSGNKTYYKKDWAIYQESNQLFFVLSLPSNYIKTLSLYGITEILIDNKPVIIFSKKETNKIKEISNYLLNH
jgi:hypothetical protein